MASHETLHRWQRIAEEGLPAERWVVARSKAITSKYAQLYLEAPHLFKWAGMAAFASYRVTLALAPFSFVVSRDRVVHLLGRLTQRDYSRHRHDVDLIRKTNNAIFADVAWAHYAFLAEGGGMPAVNAGAEAHPYGNEIVAAFRKISEGTAAAASATGAETGAEATIWEGNAALLEHEQLHVVQPAFDKLSRMPRHALRLTTAMDFHGRRARWSVRRSSSFYLYMWTAGLAHLARTSSFPHVARFDHRWAWIEHRVLPMWRRLERQDPTMQARMVNLVLQGGYEARTP